MKGILDVSVVCPQSRSGRLEAVEGVEVMRIWREDRRGGAGCGTGTGKQNSTLQRPTGWLKKLVRAESG